MGNIAFHLKDYAKAEQHYQMALYKDPKLAFAWHNLALTQKSLNKITLAKKSAAQAIEAAPPKLKDQFINNLKEI